MKVRILYNTDGTVSVIHPAPKSRRDDETEDQWLERVFAKMTPEGVTYKDIEKDQLPPDRDFRDAWIKGVNGNAIGISPVKKSIILDKIAEEGVESLIQTKIREQAITALKIEGVLTADGMIAERAIIIK